MSNVLKAELYKLVKNKAFWICAVLCVIFPVLTVTSFQANIENDLQFEPTDRSYIKAFEYTQVTSAIWALKKFLPLNYSPLLIGIFIAIFIASEFSYGTAKNMVSRGINRTKVFLSKFIVCGAASLIMQILFISMLIAAASVVWGYDPHGDASFDGLVRVILSQLLVILSFTALFTLISTTVRTYGGAIAAVILCSTVLNTIINGFSLIFGAGKTLNDYWVGGVVLKLATVAPFPDGFVRSLIVAAVWGIASIAAGIMLIKRMDIK